MRQTDITKILFSILLGLSLLGGLGPSHNLFGEKSVPPSIRAHDAVAQCQTACPPSINERKMTLRPQQKDIDPDPFPSPSLMSYQQASSSFYALALVTLALLLLQRRPPDLLTLYAIRRN